MGRTPHRGSAKSAAAAQASGPRASRAVGRPVSDAMRTWLSRLLDWGAPSPAPSDPGPPLNPAAYRNERAVNARPLSVAVIGAGPAGIYASDILSKSGLDVSIDLFERLPAPYGLVRYGVAPDHPRIKQIIVALYKILQRGDIRLIGNVEVGRDISVAELHEHYDALDRDRKSVV